MPSEDDVRLTLRLPKDLRDRLNSFAFKNGKSLNAEIVSILEFASSMENELITKDQKAKLEDNMARVTDNILKLTEATENIHNMYKKYTS